MHMRGVVGDRKSTEANGRSKRKVRKGGNVAICARGVYSNQRIGQREGYSNWDFCSHMSNGTELK